MDQKYSPNKLSYSISSTAFKRARDKKESSKSAVLRQEVKVLTQIGKEVMFYQWHCNYGCLISVCRTRSSHWWRSHGAWKERDLCVRSSSTWQTSLWLAGWCSPGCPGSGSPCSRSFHPHDWSKKPKKTQKPTTNQKLNLQQQPLKEVAVLVAKINRLGKNKLQPPGQCLAWLFPEQACF